MSKSKDKIVKSALDSYGLGKKKEAVKPTEDFNFDDDYFKSLEEDDLWDDQPYRPSSPYTQPYRQESMFPTTAPS